METKDKVISGVLGALALGLGAVAVGGLTKNKAKTSAGTKTLGLAGKKKTACKPCGR